MLLSRCLGCLVPELWRERTDSSLVARSAALRSTWRAVVQQKASLSTIARHDKSVCALHDRSWPGCTQIAFAPSVRVARPPQAAQAIFMPGSSEFCSNRRRRKKARKRLDNLSWSNYQYLSAQKVTNVIMAAQISPNSAHVSALCALDSHAVWPQNERGLRLGLQESLHAFLQELHGVPQAVPAGNAEVCFLTEPRIARTEGMAGCSAFASSLAETERILLRALTASLSRTREVS